MNTNRSYLTQSLLLAAIFVMGFLIGAFCYRQGIFPIPQLSQIIRTIYQWGTELPSHLNLFDKNLVKEVPEYMVSIPVRYLPNYKIVTESNGNRVLRTKEGHITLNVLSREVALVLVDTWNYEDTDQGEEPSQYLRCLRDILYKSRQYGVTIIHAPSQPVVDKYHQYKILSKEVENFMSDYKNEDSTPPFLDWPPRDFYSKTVEVRKKGRASWYIVNPKVGRDISKYLIPLENEFVLSSYNEFRYVLWKKRIKVLLYVGGALNECILHRDAGINLLAGSDSKRKEFIIVVLSDCTYSMGSPRFDSETTKLVMLDYYMNKIAFVANSKDLRFRKTNADDY